MHIAREGSIRSCLAGNDLHHLRVAQRPVTLRLQNGLRIGTCARTLE